jgi:imidazolonepropionase-like amidohydrolase
MSPGTDILACQFTLTELRAVVEEAHRAGLPVTAHAHAVPAVELSVAAGVDGIEHCTCVTLDGIRMPPELAEAIANAGITVCPTLGKARDAVLSPQILAVMARTGMTDEGRVAQVGELHRAGVTLIAGIDSGISQGKPHGALPESVIDLVSAGLPTAAALGAATSGAARSCGLAHRTGRLAAGLDADVLAVDGDPLTDITAVRDVRLVLSRGREVPLPP